MLQSLFHVDVLIGLINSGVAYWWVWGKKSQTTKDNSGISNYCSFRSLLRSITGAVKQNIKDVWKRPFCGPLLLPDTAQRYTTPCRKISSSNFIRVMGFTAEDLQASINIPATVFTSNLSQTSLQGDSCDVSDWMNQLMESEKGFF